MEDFLAGSRPRVEWRSIMLAGPDYVEPRPSTGRAAAQHPDSVRHAAHDSYFLELVLVFDSWK
jgi:hypothetical protein